MEEQTKIGTGAAAVIALMSILEPHLFDTHPDLAALIYVSLGCVALWGFAPIATRLTRALLKGGI
jgi:predicted membrane channel-forming protein YqfA (hemolysin III family)